MLFLFLKSSIPMLHALGFFSVENFTIGKKTMIKLSIYHTVKYSLLSFPNDRDVNVPDLPARYQYAHCFLATSTIMPFT